MRNKYREREREGETETGRRRERKKEGGREGERQRLKSFPLHSHASLPGLIAPLMLSLKFGVAVCLPIPSGWWSQSQIHRRKQLRQMSNNLPWFGTIGARNG